MMIVIVIDHLLITLLAADEELWDDGSFPHYMQRMTMKYGEGIIS